MAVPQGSVPGVEQPVSKLLLGTMIVSAQEQERSSELLDNAFANGITALDTAHGYGGGESERGIGVWMAERGNREEVTILTKGAHPGGDRKRVTYDDIAEDLGHSLERLQTDSIEIYMLHRDDTDVPVGEIVEWLNEHHAAGKIQAFGGSNWTYERIQAANDYAAAKGLTPFTTSSPHFSLAVQIDNPWGPGCVSLTGDSQAAARDWYIAADMPVFAYSSLARGLFSGRVSREDFEETADGACQKAYCYECNFERLDRATELAAEKGLSAAQVALAYALNHALNVFPLVGAANLEEIQANAEAASLELTPAEMAWLNLESDQRA